MTSTNDVTGMFSSAFVCLSISRITQKQIYRFSQNSMERRNVGFGKPLDFSGNQSVTVSTGL